MGVEIEEYPILFASTSGDEPEVIFRATSRMAKLVGYRDTEGEWVEKSLCPWDLKGMEKHMRMVEARRINQITQWFREGLINLGVPVTRSYEFFITDEGYPVHRMSYEGRNCVYNINNNRSKGRETIGLICRATSGVVEQDEPWGFAPDLRPDNFCLNGDASAAVFTDVFPPLCRDRDGKYWVHYPNPTDKSVIEREKSRKFNLIGSMRRLSFFIMWIHPGWEEAFNYQIQREFSASAASRILNEMAVLPDRMMMGLSKVKKRDLVMQLPTTAEDTIREIAVRFIPDKHPDRIKILNDIFRLSSSYTDSEMRDPQEVRFKKAKELLIKEAGF